jgi:hypothetical protein
MEPTPPKVFISHATQDKERFVIRFAERLRARGIDAWLDVWEMNPGDSLVDKIFEQGLKSCEAMIIVLSADSITSKWVREELNAGMVKRIQGTTKLIPIRLDKCEVPECLRSTIWEDIPDLEDYDLQFDRIVNGLLGHYSKPALGPRPFTGTDPPPGFPGIGTIDGRVFQIACRETISDDGWFVVTEQLCKNALAAGITRDQVEESLEILAHHQYIKPVAKIRPFPAFTVTLHGQERFLRSDMLDYKEVQQRIAVALVTATSLDSTTSIAAALDQSPRVIAFFLDMLERGNLIKVASVGSGSLRFVHEVSAELRRRASG